MHAPPPPPTFSRYSEVCLAVANRTTIFRRGKPSQDLTLIMMKLCGLKKICLQIYSCLIYLHN